MDLIETLFVKGRNYSRQFDVQTKLSTSHRAINQPVYDKALKELNDAINDLLKKKLGDMIRKQTVLSVAAYFKANTPLGSKGVKIPKDDTPPKDDKPKEGGESEQPNLTDGLEE